MPLLIVDTDIVKMEVDAIVNPANPTLLGGGGIDGEIHKAAGEKLLKKCTSLKGCNTGEAKLTKGYDLPAKYIIHTVGPIWQGGCNGERELLCKCYRNVLSLAYKKKFRTVAIPVISAGAYGYPLDEAVVIAKNEIVRFVEEHDDITVYLVMRKSITPEKRRLYSQIEYYMMQNGISGTEEVPKSLFSLTDDSPSPSRNTMNNATASAVKNRKPGAEGSAPCPMPCSDISCNVAPSAEKSNAPRDSHVCEQSSSPDTRFYASNAKESQVKSRLAKRISAPKCADTSESTSLEDMLKHLDKSFSETLLNLIDRSGMSDSECYKRANIDRKLFSKIRSDKNYKPSKPTVLAFAIALRLSLDDTRMLLERAGFALSPSNKFDVIIQFFITHGNYNIFEINEALFAFDQSLLGA